MGPFCYFKLQKQRNHITCYGSPLWQLKLLKNPAFKLHLGTKRPPPPPVWNWTTKVSFPHVVLKLISDRPQVLAEAIPYARIRGLSLIATLCSTVSFATFRGLLDFRTPLRVSLAANILNACLVACPSLISLKPSNLDFRDAKLTLTHFQEWPQGPTSYVWLWLGSLGCGCCHIHRRALLRSDFHARAFEQALI